MKKITKIPDDVRARFSEIVARNIADGLRCEPADRLRAEDALRRIYRAANLEPEVPIVWVESPLVGALAASLASNNSAVGSAVDSAVGSAVDSAVGSAVDSAVGSAVDSAVGSAVRSAVGSAVGFAVGSAVGSAVDSAVYSAKFRWHDWRGGQFWISWPAFIEAMEALGVTHPSFAALHAERDLCQSAGFYWPNRRWVMVCERPQAIRRDAEGLLHCETGPAVDYGETFRLYSWHGVAVPPHWINQRTTLDPREVIKTDNVEQRAAGAAIVGWPRMLDVLEARIVHDSGNDDIGQLLELTLPGLPQPGRFLKARCPRNGIIVEGVPRVSDIDGLPIDTALAAQAWRIGDPLSAYIHPTKRT